MSSPVVQYQYQYPPPAATNGYPINPSTVLPPSNASFSVPPNQSVTIIPNNAAAVAPVVIVTQPPAVSAAPLSTTAAPSPSSSSSPSCFDPCITSLKENRKKIIIGVVIAIIVIIIIAVALSLIKKALTSKTIVGYNDLHYQSLDSVDYDSNRIICRNITYYAAIPNEGWQIAPANDESKFVISQLGWASTAMALADSAAYYTNAAPHSGTLYLSNALTSTIDDNRQLKWGVSKCDIGILLVKDPSSSGKKLPTVSYFSPTRVVYKGNYYKTIDNIDPSEPTIGCMNGQLPLPSGYRIASNDVDTITVIRAFHWGTNALILADGNGYSTGPNGLYWDKNLLVTNGNNYGVQKCDARILITNAP